MDLLDQAKSFAREGKYEAALGLFREAGGAEGHFGAAGCLYRLGHLKEAEQEVRRCLELDPLHKKGRDLLEKLKMRPTGGARKKCGPGDISVARVVTALGLLVAGTAVMMVVGVILIEAGLWPEKPRKPRTPQTDPVGAYVAAEGFVTQRLKAPASAKFPWYDDGYVVYHPETRMYVVTAYVDSQNVFGAMLRTYWVCKVRKEGQYWRLDDILLQ